MAECIVKTPSYASTGDYDFLAFSFNGKHSWDDFNIYRVIDGDRYTDELAPQMTDRTSEIPGTDGMLFFGSNHKSKVFNINIAFEGLTEEKLRAMKQWLNGKEMGNLWFDECPYKVYTAKVTSTPSLKYISFDNDKLGRIYKGEGTIQFTAYWPYAHTPDYVDKRNGSSFVRGGGKTFSSYSSFRNCNDWKEASGLEEESNKNKKNPGDIPAPFELKYSNTIPAGKEAVFKITNDCQITVGGEGQKSLTDLKWDSRTGMVSAKIGNDTVVKPIAYSGNSLGAIPVGGTDVEFKVDGRAISNTQVIVSYHYWYY